MSDSKKPKLIGTGVQVGICSDGWRQEVLKLRLENRRLREVLGQLAFCEEAEFYSAAIERASPYCIDFEKWHKDALAELNKERSDEKVQDDEPNK